MNKRLYKSSTDKKICGVCAGLAEYFNIDPTIVRILVVCITVFTAVMPCIIVYFILAAIMPENPVSNMNQDDNDKTDF